MQQLFSHCAHPGAHGVQEQSWKHLGVLSSLSSSLFEGTVGQDPSCTLVHPCTTQTELCHSSSLVFHPAFDKLHGNIHLVCPTITGWFVTLLLCCQLHCRLCFILIKLWESDNFFVQARQRPGACLTQSVKDLYVSWCSISI